MTLLASLRHSIERRLYGMGFAMPVPRHLLCTQVILTGTALVAGLLLFWLTLWPLAFGLGALIATYSLWHTIRFAQASVQRQFSLALGIRLGVGFSARLLLIGTVLFVLIVLLTIPVVPLLAGLTSTVVGIVLWGIFRSSRKTVKEA